MSETIILESIIDQLRKENAELKQSQSQKQKIKMYDKIQELEKLNKELVDTLKICKETICNSVFVTDTLWISINETLVDRINYYIGEEE